MKICGRLYNSQMRKSLSENIFRCLLSSHIKHDSCTDLCLHRDVAAVSLGMQLERPGQRSKVLDFLFEVLVFQIPGPEKLMIFFFHKMLLNNGRKCLLSLDFKI